jgi:multiple sugar transport system permease protein/arabinosaccharide transport system permease protein
MSLLDIWNDYLWPLIVTTDPSMFTITLGLLRFTGSFSTPLYGPTFAGYIVTALPLIVLFLCLMNSFIEGMTAGAIKA